MQADFVAFVDLAEDIANIEIPEQIVKLLSLKRNQVVRKPRSGRSLPLPRLPSRQLRGPVGT